MRVHEAEREGGVVIRRGLHIRHRVAVPADGDGLVERQTGAWESGEPFVLRPRGGEQHAAPGEQCRQ
jgi:hypothetical protein